MSKTYRRGGYESEEYTLTLSFIPVCDNHRHLVCLPYSVENLHQMAKELKIGESWFHAGRLPHYDIPKKRRDDIEALCVRVGSREIVSIIRGKTISFDKD